MNTKHTGAHWIAGLTFLLCFAAAGCEESMSAKSYPELSMSGVWEMTDNEGMAKFLGIDTPPGGSYCMDLDEFSGKGRIQFLENPAPFAVRFRRPSGELSEGMAVTIVYKDAERDGHIEVKNGIDRRPLIYLHFDDSREKRKQYGGYNGILSPGYYDRAGLSACVKELEKEYSADLESQENE